MDTLLDQMKNMTINDNRMMNGMPKINEISTIDILAHMIKNINLTDEIDNLANEIECMDINDDSVVIKTKTNRIMIFYFNQCRLEYNNYLTIPKWGEAS